MRRADTFNTFVCRESGNLGASNSWKPLGLSRPVIELLYLFIGLNKPVLHTICAEAANIRASYVSINSMMMSCMESNWMIQTEQQMEKNSFGNSLVINTTLSIYSKA